MNELNVTANDVRECMHHGDSLLFVELRHHHKNEWSLFKARGSLSFEFDSLEQHLTEIPHDRPIVVFSDCPDEEHSDQATRFLLNRGWSDVHKLVGGFNAYLEAGLPVEPISKNVPASRIMLL
jgi:rhodanese-related sulfurtransferase